MAAAHSQFQARRRAGSATSAQPQDTTQTQKKLRVESEDGGGGFVGPDEGESSDDIPDYFRCPVCMDWLTRPVGEWELVLTLPHFPLIVSARAQLLQCCVLSYVFAPGNKGFFCALALVHPPCRAR
jgi:hypothetical protein